MAKSRRAPEEDARSRRPDDDEDDAPRRRRRAADDEDEDDDEGDDGPIKPRRKKKSAAGPVKIVLRIVGAVLGAILLIIFLVWVYTPVGTDYQLLCYFPKETTRLQGYDVDEVSRNGKMTEVHTLVMNNYKVFGDRRFGGDTGVKETDVLRYLSGHVSGDPDEEKDLPPQQKRGDITVIRFKRDVDEAKFVASFTGTYLCEEQQSKEGKKYYQLWWKRRVPPDNHEEREDDISFFFPNSKTLVYATTRRELTECMTRTPGKVVLDGNIRDLADKVDGHYFNASAEGGGGGPNGVSNSIALGLGFMDEEFKDARRFTGVVGTASWFASNGNDFLFASGNLYGDAKTARDVRRKIAASLHKAQEDIWQSDSGKPGGLTDPFNAPQPKTGGGPGGPPGGGLAMAAVGPSSEQTKDIIDALANYTRTARVYNRGKLVVIEGLIEHGTPEQGIFEKFFHAVQPKFQVQGAGMGGMMPGGGLPLGGGPPPPGMAPGNVPIGPGR